MSRRFVNGSMPGRRALMRVACAALLVGAVGGCALDGVGFDDSIGIDEGFGYAGGYYDPYGYDYGGWGGGYLVGPPAWGVGGEGERGGWRGERGGWGGEHGGRGGEHGGWGGQRGGGQGGWGGQHGGRGGGQSYRAAPSGRSMPSIPSRRR